ATTPGVATVLPLVPVGAADCAIAVWAAPIRRPRSVTAVHAIRLKFMSVETSLRPYWFSFHSSYQAIWMASSFGSFELFGSSSNPSRCITLSRRSVNLTVRGSSSGKRSTRAIPMSSASVHFMAPPPFRLAYARSGRGGRVVVFAVGLSQLNCAAFLHVISRVHGEFHRDVALDHRLTAQA